MTRRLIRGTPIDAAIFLGLCACDGPASALSPAAREAHQLAQLFWASLIGAGVIWALFVGIAWYAAYARREPISTHSARRLVVTGGIIVPTLLLTALLTVGLAQLPQLLGPAPANSLRIAVAGEQWWWRVRYLAHGHDPVELANEIRLPVGAPVEFQLSSPDVIHSFWIPPLAGKMDMIPGRVTRLRVHPTRTGTFRGICAEYCGASHAFMNFAAIVSDRPGFERWLAEQRKPAAAPASPLAAEGATLFLATGCGACHSVRGTAADGVIGPDLTHVGSRVTLGAGMFQTDAARFERWVASPDALKPGVHMPAFRMLPKRELGAIAAYLASLR